MSCGSNDFRECILPCILLMFAPILLGQSLAAAEQTTSLTIQQQKELQTDFDIAISAQESSNPLEVIQLWRDLAERAPHASTPYANIALLQFQLGRLDEAESSLKHAIELHPDAAYYNQLGIVQRNKGNFIEAKNNYESALALNEAYARAHLNLAILCDLYLGELDVALLHYKRYQELSTTADSSNVNNWIADLERRLKVSH